MRNNRWAAVGLVALVLLVAGLLLRSRRGEDAAPLPGASPASAAAAAPPRAEAPAGDAARRAAPPAEPPSPLRMLPAARAEDTPARSGAFEGRVVSAASGEGVGGAELTFASAAGAVSVRSGRGGAFRFAPDAPGAYQLAVVTAEGFLPFGPEWGQSPIQLTATPGKRIRDIVLALTPEVELSGRVVGPDGLPVEGAQVRLLTGRGGLAALFPTQDTFASDAHGEFRFRAPEEAWVEARHPRYTSARVQVTRAVALERRVTLRLGKQDAQAAPHTAALAGRVVDGGGSPVAGAHVSVRSAARAYPKVYGEPLGLDAVTDADGRFRVEGLEAGTYDVGAVLQGLAPGRLGDVPAGREDLLLRLEQGVRLEGVVVDATAAPVPSFTVSVQAHVGPLRREGYAEQQVMDAEGRYALSGLLPGTYTVQVAAHGHAPAERTLEVAGGTRGPVRVDFMLSRGARLTGRVVEAKKGTPIPRATLSVEGMAGGGALAVRFDALTDAHGDFSIEGLIPGEVSLYVGADRHHSRILSGVTVRADAPNFQRIELRAVPEGEEPQLEMVGIGAVLAARDDALVLGQVIAGGGAAEAGLVTGDGVVRVDGTPVVDLGFPEAIQRIRGPENSRVILGVRRAGKQEVVDVPVVRRRLQM